MNTLIKNLRSNDRRLRAGTVRAATESDDRTFVESLIGLIHDEDYGDRARQEVARSLGRSGHPRACECLLELIRAGDPNLRGLAAVGLAKVKNKAAVEALVHALEDRDVHVRNLAERSLLEMLDTVREHGIESLLVALERKAPLMRSPAARVLGRAGDARALPPLTTHLQTAKQWLTRMWMAKGLGDLGMAEAFAPLVHALHHDENHRVRATAAEAVGKLHLPQSEPALTKALEDEDGGVRRVATEALDALRRGSFAEDDETD